MFSCWNTFQHGWRLHTLPFPPNGAQWSILPYTHIAQMGLASFESIFGTALQGWPEGIPIKSFVRLQLRIALMHRGPQSFAS